MATTPEKNVIIVSYSQMEQLELFNFKKCFLYKERKFKVIEPKEH